MINDPRATIPILLGIFFLLSCFYMGCARSNKTYVNAPPTANTPHNNYQTYDPPLKLYVINDNVNIRSGPGKENGVIASGKKGQLITVSGKKDDWYYTQLKNGKDGYIHESLLTDVKPRVISTTPAIGSGDNTMTTPPAGTPSENNGMQTSTTTGPPSPAPSAETAVLKSGKAKVNSLSAAKVRSNASPFAKVTGELQTGTQVEIIEVTGNWCLIKAGQIEGYVTSNSLIQ